MKKQIKFIVIISLFIQFSSSSYAQSVVAEMSIEYSCDHSFQIDSIVKVPYLVIRYENRSDSCFYLPKITFTDETLPCMGAVLLSSCNTNRNTPKTHYYQHANFSDSVFIVSVNQLWNLYSKNILINDEDEASVSILANTEIEDLRHVYTNTDTKLRFMEDEISSNTILSDNNDYFVHLEPNQIHTDRYCLALFEAFGGQYEFRLSPQYSPVRVQRETGFEYMVESESAYIELPKKVGQYYLYQSNLLCDAVSVSFRTNMNYGQEGKYVLNEDQKVTITIKNNYYALDIDNSYDDVLVYDRVSMGKYERHGDIIQLKDILLNFTMEMRVVNSRDLMLTKGFHLWMGKTFKYDHEIPQWDWTRSIENYETHTKNICIHWRSDTIFVCDTGWYVRKNCRHGTDFHLNEEGRFEFTIGDMIFLSGYWNQMGNLLVFKDDIIANPFYAVIVEDGIIPFMPNILGLWTYNLYDEKRRPFQTE